MKEFFTKTALPYVLTAAMMSVALPAMAEHHCTAEDKTLIKPVKGHGMRVIDFSKTSESCLNYYAEGTSGVYLTLVAESDSQAYYNATVEAAKRLKQEGAKVQVLYSTDKDGSDKTAMTVAWANGVKRDFAPIKIGGDLTVNHVAAAQEKVVGFIYEVGSEVWNTYLKVPPKVPAIAMNN